MKKIILFLSLAFAALSLNGCIIAEKGVISIHFEDDGSGTLELTAYDLRSTASSDAEIREDISKLIEAIYSETDNIFVKQLANNGRIKSRELFIEGNKVNCKIVCVVKNSSDFGMKTTKDGSFYLKVPQGRKVISDNGQITVMDSSTVIKWSVGEKNPRFEVTTKSPLPDTLGRIAGMVRPYIEKTVIKGRRN